MNVLMLNPVHPDMPHISAVRAWRFAQELAKLGHRVVLLCATSTNGNPTLQVDPHHDWRRPCVLACANATPSEPSLPQTLRRARTALQLLWHGGGAREWLRAAVAVGTQLPLECRPGVIWCTFGHMEAVFAARRIARRLRCPWVLDVKDSWELFVPHGLRRLMAWRTRGFAAVSANAEINRRMIRNWLGVDSTLIYSGVEDCFFATSANPIPPTSFEINLVGGIYFPELLQSFLTGVAAWYEQLPKQSRARVTFRYIGSQGELVGANASAAVPDLRVALPGYVAAAEMGRLCQNACVNAYIAHRGGFHHKLPELLACGKPVLAYPSEHDESVTLANSVPGQLTVASTPAEVASLLAALSTPFFDHHQLPAYPPTHLAGFAWSAQALLLQRVLATAIASK